MNFFFIEPAYNTLNIYKIILSFYLSVCIVKISLLGQIETQQNKCLFSKKMPLKTTKNKINVVAAIIENDKLEILCALRSSIMSLSNLWEFPGGKVDKEESEIEALKREIKEELLCEIQVISQFDDYTHEYEKMSIRLITYKCLISQGTPIATEHAKLIWLKREYLKSLVWAPADISTLDKLVKEQ